MKMEAFHKAFRGKKLAIAESCTGGAIGAKITAQPGASEFFLGSLVVYSNAWKETFLGVSSKTLEKFGAVSSETVKEMALALFQRTEADFVAAVSGIAGPGGGTVEKPVGTIFIAVGRRGGPLRIERIHAPQPRAAAIQMATETTLSLLLELVNG